MSESAKPPHFLVHNRADNVGVIVVEGLKAGSALRGVVLEDDTTCEVTATADIPLGHKIALSDLDAGATVIKYGEDIGRLIAPVARGDHVHVHNLKTKRW